MLNIEIDIAMVVKGKQETETTFVAFQVKDHRLQNSVFCNYLYLLAFETVGKQSKFYQCAYIFYKTKLVILLA